MNPQIAASLSNGEKTYFPPEEVPLLPITFAFGEPVNSDKMALEMSTSFSGEESMTGVNGGYDTGG